MPPFANPLTQQIATFLRTIGLEIEPRSLDETSFLPGLALENGRILVDEARMLYPR